MASKVNNSPSLPNPGSLSRVQDVVSYITQLVNTVTSELTSHAQRLNLSVPADGTEIPSAPVIYKSYVKASLPSASKFINGMIIVSNDTGGLTPAFSDGTNWRRVADRNIIS